MISRTTLAKNIAQNMTLKSVSNATANYLLKTNRVSELQSLMRDVAKARFHRDGVLEVTAITSRPIGETQKAEIYAWLQKNYVSAKEIIINEQIDKSVIGGVRLELLDGQIDMSVDGKIRSLKKLVNGENQ